MIKPSLTNHSFSRAKMLFLFSILSLALFLPVFKSSSAFAMPAILPLENKPLRISFWHQVLRDPGLKVDRISDDLYFEQNESEIISLKSDLRRAKGIARMSLLKSLYLKSVARVRYLEDVLSQKVHSFALKDKADKLLLTSRRLLVKTVNQYAKLEKNKTARARALYHSLTTYYLRGEVKTILSLERIEKHLPSYLNKRIAILRAYHTKSLSKEQVADLVAAKKRIHNTGVVAANFILAKHYAGKKNIKKYRSYLYSATLSTRQFSKDWKEELFKGALTIWRSAEPRSSFENPPIPLKYFKDHKAMQAIYERIALSYLKKGNTYKAARIYRGLSKSHNGTLNMVKFDRRVLEIEAIAYKKSQNASSYERALKAMVLKYRSPSEQIEGPERLKPAALESFQKSYYWLVNSFLTKAERRPSDEKKVYNAALMAQNYLSLGARSEGEALRLKERIAKLYARSGNYRLAVSLFDDLMESSSSRKK